MEKLDGQEDPVPKLTIDDLPNELLLRILQKVEPKLLGTVSLVSKRWNIIINEMIGRKLFVGRQCQLVPQDEDRFAHTYVDISEIAKIGICECFIGEVPEPTRSLTLWTRLLLNIKKTLFNENQVIRFKYPYLVKRLHFDGPIPDQYFESMLKNVVNLNRLELHMTAFCCINHKNLKELGYKWKNLEDLSIWGHKLTDGLFTDFYDAKNIMPNLLTFLSNNFRALSYFAFEYPFDIRDDKALTREILSFLKRHPKLVTMRICINIPITEEGSDFETFEDREWTREAKSVSKLLHLKYFELIISSMRRVRLTKMWMAFVERQRDLENMTVLSFRIPSIMLANICENNKANLKKLYISRILMTIDNRPVQLDASIITGCTQLTNLTIEGMIHSTTTAGLTSTKLLPNTLVNLEIGGLLLLHRDAHDLFFELPNLAWLCLTDIGNRGEFGVTIETIQMVIHERRIPNIQLYRSVCGDFPTTGIHNGDPNCGWMIRMRPYEILEMKLNAEKYYESLYMQTLIEDFDDD